MKAAKLAIRLVLPALARPPAIPTRLLSEIPMLKKRSGCFLPNHSVRVELLTSPSSTTRSGYFSPRASRARPKASRVALPSARLVWTAEDSPAMISAPFNRTGRCGLRSCLWGKSPAQDTSASASWRYFSGIGLPWKFTSPSLVKSGRMP